MNRNGATGATMEHRSFLLTPSSRSLRRRGSTFSVRKDNQPETKREQNGKLSLEGSRRFR
jgi:hypothetical protein